MAGTLAWNGGFLSGVLTLASNGVLNFLNPAGLAFSGLVLTNYGTVNWTNSALYGFNGLNAQIYNYGLWNEQSDDNFQGKASGNGGTTYSLTISGTFRKSGNAGVTTLDANVVFNNTGVLDAESGTLSLANYNLTGGVMNFGIGSLANSAQVVLAGNPATLDGALTAHFTNNFAPVLGNQFQILSFASLSGNFTSVSAPGGVFVSAYEHRRVPGRDEPGGGSSLVNWTQPSAITYGALLSSNQLNATANLPGTFAYTPAIGTFFTAGTHLLSVVFTPTDTVHYSPESDTLSLFVLPAPLTITASNTSMTYGGSVPALSIGYSGFVQGQTPASLATAPTFSTAGTSLSHAGNYPITVGGAVDTNYHITYVAGTLTINTAPLAITASNASKTYGQTAVLSPTAFASVGLLNGDTVAGVTLTSSGAAPTAGATTYPIVPSAASGPGAGNYAITYNNGTLDREQSTVDDHRHQRDQVFWTHAGFRGHGIHQQRPAKRANGRFGHADQRRRGLHGDGRRFALLHRAQLGDGRDFRAGELFHQLCQRLVDGPRGGRAAQHQLRSSGGRVPNTGGTTVTITGTGFESGAAVTFGSLPGTSITLVNSNTLTAITPASPSSTVGVGVNNPDGNRVTNLNAFQFGNAPLITAQPNNRTLNQGQTAQFSLQVTGDPDPGLSMAVH